MQQRVTESDRARIELGLSAPASFVNDSYELAKERCLTDLFRASRAYVFWQLKPLDLFGDLLRGRRPEEVDHALLLRAKGDILKKLEDAWEDLARPPQQFNKITIRLSRLPQVLDTLRKNEAAIFQIEPVRFGMKKSMSPFAGLAQVRLTKIRAWAIGLQTGANDQGNLMHHIVLTHLGRETVVSEWDEALDFVHERVDTTVIYNSAFIGKDKAFQKGAGTEDGTLNDPEGNTVYADIGPFASWRIAIPDDLNLDLNLGTLEDVEIEFHGSNYTLKANPRTRQTGPAA